MIRATLSVIDEEAHEIKTEVNFEQEEFEEFLDFVDSVRLIQAATADQLEFDLYICFNPAE